MAENTPSSSPFQSCNRRMRINSGSGDSGFFCHWFPAGCSRTRYPEGLFWMADPMNTNIGKTSSLPLRNLQSCGQDTVGSERLSNGIKGLWKNYTEGTGSREAINIIPRCRWVGIRWHSRKPFEKGWCWSELVEIAFEEMGAGFSGRVGHQVWRLRGRDLRKLQVVHCGWSLGVHWEVVKDAAGKEDKSLNHHQSSWMLFQGVWTLPWKNQGIINQIRVLEIEKDWRGVRRQEGQIGWSDGGLK